VGYIIAEFHGRDLEHFRQIAARVVLWGGGISALLEVARGFHPAYHASALMLLITIGAAAFGGWLYQLQRDHVRTLLARRSRNASRTSAVTPAVTAAVLYETDGTSNPTSIDPVAPVLSAL
jgi:hypothetical protein